MERTSMRVQPCRMRIVLVAMVTLASSVAFAQPSPDEPPPPDLPPAESPPAEEPAPVAPPVVVVPTVVVAPPPPVVVVAPPARASRTGRVPLLDNFPVWEIVGIGGLAGANILLKTYEYDLAADRGSPLIGDAPGFDKSISNALYKGPFAQPFGLHLPELVMTEVGPVVYASLYGLDTVSLWIRGKSLSGATNPDHKLFAFAESQFLTAVVNLSVKIGVGRERPYEALGRYGSDPGQPKTTLSFFSNQTAASFAFVAFGWRDLSDWLTSGPMADYSDTKRLWLGRVLPGAVLFTAGAWDGYSRIVDQRHWFTDVLAGAVVGTVLGYGTYAFHFDWNGDPKRRWASDHHLQLVPSNGGEGATLMGVF